MGKNKSYSFDSEETMNTLADKCREIRNVFDEEVERSCLGDDYLKSINAISREDNEIAGDYSYGIVWLRDDAVFKLLDYIDCLESKLKH